MVNELSTRAWDVSKSRLALSIEIGHAITGAFSFARDENCIEREEEITSTGLPAGYDRYMGGPLVACRKAYSRYADARDALQAYDRDVYTPTFTNVDVTDSITDKVQEAYDILLTAEHEAIEWLYRTPAPSASELAIKLKIFEGAEGWALTYAPEAIRRISIDARRVGRYGAHLLTDQLLLAAFAAWRREFEAADKDPWTA